MDNLGSNHFLSLPRPDILAGPPAGVVDTTTLAAHDFDVDTRTGFMPPQPPLARLPSEWEPWEVALDSAIEQKLQLGDKPGLPQHEVDKSERWRSTVRNLPILPITNLKTSEITLRRAHTVLAWVMHFYVHTLPPTAPISIPPPVTLPLLQVSAQLQLPPVLTYSDDVLYNWALLKPSPSHSSPLPALDNLRCVTLFTSTSDESEFYLSSARIEFRGVEALELMQAIMDEVFVGDAIAVHRITGYLHRIAAVIKELQTLLMTVRAGCDPEVFFREVRPWFRGADSDPGKREWVFEGMEQDPTLRAPLDLSGPSAGQSPLVHALDTFLGLDKYSHAVALTGSSGVSSKTGEEVAPKMAFLARMQLYMPRHHRAFLNHLSANPRPLREFVTGANNDLLVEAYNAAVLALKEFRDAHIIIVSLYIIGPARRLERELREKDGKLEEQQTTKEPLKGTGGTELAKFLKDVRDQTAGAVMAERAVSM